MIDTIGTKVNSTSATPKKNAHTAGRSHLPLPDELLRNVVESDCFSVPEVLRLRLVTKQWQKAVDHAMLPHFPRPTTSLISKEPRHTGTLSSFLAAERESSSRKLSGSLFRQEAVVGPASLFFHEENGTLLVRCGNGRVVQADIASRSGIFSEVAPPHSLSEGEELIGASHRLGDNTPWRLLTYSARDQERFLYSFRQNQCWRQRLVRRPMPEPDTFRNYFFQHEVTFSDCGKYFAERFPDGITHYEIRDESQSIVELRNFANTNLTSFCPKTGHLFKATVEPSDTLIRISTPERLYSRRLQTYEEGSLKALSVSPDGQRFSTLCHRTSRVENVEIQTFTLKTYYPWRCNSKGQLEPVFVQALVLEGERDDRHDTKPSWHFARAQGWVLCYRKYIRTADLDRDPRWRIGLEGSRKMTSLFVPETGNKSLFFLASISQENIHLSKPKNLTWQKFLYQLDQFVLRRELSGDKGAMAYCVAGTFLLFQECLRSGVEHAIWSALFNWSAACVAFGLLILQMYTAWLKRRSAATSRQFSSEPVDLQHVELPPSE